MNDSAIPVFHPEENFNEKETISRVKTRCNKTAVLFFLGCILGLCFLTSYFLYFSIIRNDVVLYLEEIKILMKRNYDLQQAYVFLREEIMSGENMFRELDYPEYHMKEV